MLLTGTYRRSVDDKQRVAIPKRLRDALKASCSGSSSGSADKDALYIAPGTDGSLALYTEGAFSELGARLAQGSPAGQEVRAFSRLFYSQAQRVEMDGQGRFRIPPELFGLAGLGGEVVLVGVRDHMELWDPAKWEKYLEEKQRQYDAIAERAFSQNGPSTAPPAPPNSAPAGQ
ncbi:MAG: division/cell wall cluster transcriptional repressor MraZ [Pirellulaceae bacterium]|nr:division/cell wall cluster transcriptional repressor MraZ [Planctomycetales bacterium]